MLLALTALALAQPAEEGWQDDDAWLDAGEPPALDTAQPLRNADTEQGHLAAAGLGAFNFTACSGSLITPRIVLSAAHCGGDLSPETIVSVGQAYFGTTPDTAEISVGFEEWIPHPEYVPLGTSVPQTLPQNDVGVVVLDEPVEGIEPVWIRTEAMSDAEIGVMLTSVGWGSTDEAGSGSGTKRSGQLSIDGFEEQFVLSSSSTNPNQAQICSGDSGGPMYYEHADGRLEQWAVHSYGDQNCTSYSGSTRTDLVSEFILGEVERIHGTRDFCEINGLYGDGTCDAQCAADPDCLADEDEELRGCACTTAAPLSTSWVLLGLGLIGLRRRR